MKNINYLIARIVRALKLLGITQKSRAERVACETKLKNWEQVIYRANAKLVGMMMVNQSIWKAKIEMQERDE